MKSNKKIIGIIVNPRKEKVHTPLESLDKWISQTKPDAKFILCTYNSIYVKKRYKNLPLVSEEKILNKSEIIVTLGGDGTILRAVYSIGSSETPILGVNLGGLGFLAETAPEMLTGHLQAYLSNNYVIENRTMMKCHVEKTNYTFYAFNDIVIDKAGFSRVIEIETYIDESLLNSYIADALILSTPTGSTGYSLSAGGPIVIPQTNVFIVNPICPHSLTNRPVVVPDDSVISIKVFTEYKEVNVFRDGQMDKSYPSGTSFVITKGEYPAKLIKTKEKGFYDTLRNKLLWGKDFRDKDHWSYKNFKE